MAWDEQRHNKIMRPLFERALQGVDGPLEQTLEVLLWRGFLVMKQENALYLSAGSHQDDIELLRRFLHLQDDRDNGSFPMVRGVHTCDSEQAVAPSADTWMRIRPTEDCRTLYRLFAYPPHNHMTAPFTYGAPIRNEYSWRVFRHMRYGVKSPVKHLDPGIALLVKALPLLGLYTVMSCDGHTEKPPEIYFLSRYHLLWARVALPQFLPEGDPFVKQWIFKCEDEDKGWLSYQWLLAPNGCGEDPDAQYALYANIQRVARNILYSYWDEEGNYTRDKGLACDARECKKRLTGPKDLLNPEYYVFSKDHDRNFELPYLEISKH